MELCNQAEIVKGQRIHPWKLERAKELRREQTPAEKLLWSRLRNNQLNGIHFRRQQIIDGFIADFYCHKAGLVIEVDGGIHKARTEFDMERDRIFEARSLKVMRISNEKVLNRLPEVLRQISMVCTEINIT